MVKDSLANAGDTRDTVLIPGLGRSPGGRKGNPLQYSCLENPHGQGSLVGYSPWGCKESNTMAGLSTHTHIQYRLKQSSACIYWLSCLRCTINLFFLPLQQTRWCVKQAGQVWNQIDLFLFRFCWTWGRGLRVLSVKWGHWYPLGKTGVRISGNVHGDANLIDAPKENKWW